MKVLLIVVVAIFETFVWGDIQFQSHIQEKDNDFTPSNEIDQNFNNEALEAHNEYRAKHGVGPLTISPDICTDVAQEWANHLAKNKTLRHRGDFRYGENLYWFSAEIANGRIPVDAWYSEVSIYDWRNMEWQAQAGHFTQIVWKRTTEICVARARADDGSTFVVANYKPPGNNDDFSQNVAPAKI